ncbi:MAG: pimeloyl-CoA dehydrogenase small subunit [Gammaproteobacteria bacterium]|nr:pimeloyl-CoA dehydrogenase small subunit [Gammaproteobacteria bacterium]
MNFEFNEEQKMLKESMQRWFQDNYSFEQRSMIAASADGFSRENWASFAELGWLSIPFSEQHGGYGGNIIDTVAMMEEFGKALVLEPVVPSLLLFGGLLEASGNAELASATIPGIIDGSLLGALASYEAQARFDLANIATTAVREGDHYMVTGEKSLVSGGAHADQFIVSARTSGAQTDDAGISLFLVERDSAGLAIDAHQLMDGQQVADLRLDKVKVSADRLISEVDMGYAMLQSVLQNLDVALCAEALGIMQKLNATTVEYTKTRKQFGVPISSFQVLQHRMVDTFMAYEQSKSLLYGTLCELTDGVTSAQDAGRTVKALRTLVAKYGKLVGDEAIQMHGGMGITDELDVGHYVKRLMMINLLFGNGDFYQKQFNHLAYQ